MGDTVFEIELLQGANNQVIAATFWEGCRTGIEGLGQNVPDALSNLSRELRSYSFNTLQDITDWMMKNASSV